MRFPRLPLGEPENYRAATQEPISTLSNYHIS
jgi:hypothetical protein